MTRPSLLTRPLHDAATAPRPSEIIIPRVTQRAPARESPHWLYVGTAVAGLATSAIGFAPQFYLQPALARTLAPHVIAHGLLFSGWLVLFLVQTVLVAIGHTRLHRTLGIVGAGMAAIMLVSTPPMAIAMARRGEPRPDPLVFLLVIVTDLFLFAASVGAAIYYRRRPEAHKRLMLLAVVCLLPPGISRWPIAATNPATLIPGILLVFLVAPVVSDFVVSRRRPHPISLWGGLAIIVSIPLRFAVAQTAVWHQFATWLIR